MEENGSPLPMMHTVPTHLATADTVLSLGMLSLSSRQLLLVLLGGSAAVSLWTRTVGLATFLPPLGLALHWLLLILLSLSVLALTFGQVQGRSLDAWGIVTLTYLVRPRLHLWDALREGPKAFREEDAA